MVLQYKKIGGTVSDVQGIAYIGAALTKCVGTTTGGTVLFRTKLAAGYTTLGYTTAIVALGYSAYRAAATSYFASISSDLEKLRTRLTAIETSAQANAVQATS